jgi:hypothetical protein
MADTAALVVALSAQLSQFQKDMDRANQIANDNVKKIEDSFNKINPNAEQMLGRFADSAKAPAESAGQSIGNAIVVGFIGALGALALRLTSIIEGLAKIGDRAEDLRLPVNLLQALSVAAESARLPQEKLNAALDKFTEVSKKTKDDAEEFYKALRNIGQGFVTAFEKAPTQAERLNIVSNALKSTNDEVKRAQLLITAFGTDSERAFQVFGQGAEGIDRDKQRLRELGLEVDDLAVNKARQARSDLALLARVISDELSSAIAGLIPNLATVVRGLEVIGQVSRLIQSIFQRQAEKPADVVAAEVATIDKEIEKLEAERDRIAADKPTFGDTVRNWIHGGMELLGADAAALKQTTATITDELDKLRERRDEILELQRETARGRATSAVSARGPGAFVPRPSLKQPLDEGKTAFESQVDSINRHIAALNADAAAVGKTAAEHEQLRTELALLQSIQRDSGEVTQEQIDKYAVLRASMSDQQALVAAGIKLNQEHAESFTALSARIRIAAQAFDDAKKQQQALSNAIQFAGNEFINIFDALRNKTQSASDAMRKLTDNILKALEQALLLGSGPLAGILGTATSVPGGTGGLLGALFAKRQSGGPVSAGRSYVVGEHGPELFIPKSAGSIVPHQLASSGGSAAGGLKVVVNNYASGQTETTQERRQGPTGEELIIGIVKKVTATGELDSANRGRFGLRANKVR